MNISFPKAVLTSITAKKGKKISPKALEFITNNKDELLGTPLPTKINITDKLIGVIKAIKGHIVK